MQTIFHCKHEAFFFDLPSLPSLEQYVHLDKTLLKENSQCSMYFWNTNIGDG